MPLMEMLHQRTGRFRTSLLDVLEGYVNYSPTIRLPGHYPPSAHRCWQYGTPPGENKLVPPVYKFTNLYWVTSGKTPSRTILV